MDGTTISPNQPKQDTQEASESVSLSLPSAANTELKKTQMIPHSDSVATSCVEESQTAETKMEQSFPVQPEASVNSAPSLFFPQMATTERSALDKLVTVPDPVYKWVYSIPTPSTELVEDYLHRHHPFIFFVKESEKKPVVQSPPNRPIQRRTKKEASASSLSVRRDLETLVFDYKENADLIPFGVFTLRKDLAAYRVKEPTPYRRPARRTGDAAVDWWSTDANETAKEDVAATVMPVRTEKREVLREAKREVSMEAKREVLREMKQTLMKETKPELPKESERSNRNAAESGGVPLVERDRESSKRERSRSPREEKSSANSFYGSRYRHRRSHSRSHSRSSSEDSSSSLSDTTPPRTGRWLADKQVPAYAESTSKLYSTTTLPSLSQKPVEDRWGDSPNLPSSFSHFRFILLPPIAPNHWSVCEQTRSNRTLHRTITIHLRHRLRRVVILHEATKRGSCRARTRSHAGTGSKRNTARHVVVVTVRVNQRGVTASRSHAVTREHAAAIGAEGSTEGSTLSSHRTSGNRGSRTSRRRGRSKRARRNDAAATKERGILIV